MGCACSSDAGAANDTAASSPDGFVAPSHDQHQQLDGSLVIHCHSTEHGLFNTGPGGVPRRLPRLLESARDAPPPPELDPFRVVEEGGDGQRGPLPMSEATLAVGDDFEDDLKTTDPTNPLLCPPAPAPDLGEPAMGPLLCFGAASARRRSDVQSTGDDPPSVAFTASVWGRTVALSEPDIQAPIMVMPSDGQYDDDDDVDAED